ncbi:hypothetical protein D3C76_827330 [compost metagenome]
MLLKTLYNAAGRSDVQRLLQWHATGSGLVLWRTHLRRVHARTLHRLDHADAAALLGHGNGLHRFQPLRRAYKLQSRLPCYRHLHWGGRRGAAGADLRADPRAAGTDRCAVDGHIVVPLLASAHRQQLCVDAGGLHPADDRLAGGGQPLGGV